MKAAMGEVTAPGTTPGGPRKQALARGERVAALCRRVRGYFIPRVGEPRGGKRQVCTEREEREKTPHPRCSGPPSLLRQAPPHQGRAL